MQLFDAPVSTNKVALNPLIRERHVRCLVLVNCKETEVVDFIEIKNTLSKSYRDALPRFTYFYTLSVEQVIDTHTHLYVEAFDEDREEAIQNALAEGVTDFYIPAIDSTYHQQMFALEQAYPTRVHLMMGLHPTHVKENYKDELEVVKQQLNSRSFSAVGEIGIDLYWDQSFLKQQQYAFNFQIEWAKSKGLPIVIHCRDAFDEVFEVLEGHRGDDLFGIFHCFTGTIAQAHRAIDLNLKLGIGGVVTFKNGKIDQFLATLPLTSLVMETDAPYLAPSPHRGKRNESAYLPLIRDKIAQCYQLSAEEISRITTENAKAVFENQK